MKRRSFEQSDHIRLNLEWLDRRERTAVPPLYRICARTPLLPPAAAMIVGIWAALQFSASVNFIIVAAGLLTTAALIAVSFRLSPLARLFLLLTAVSLLFAGLGAVRLAAVRYCPPDHILHSLKEPDQLATLRGRIISPVHSSEPARGVSNIPWLSDQSSFYLSVDAVQTPSGWQTITGTVRVQVNEHIETIAPGNTILLYGRLNRFFPPANPGQFDIRQHMHIRGVYVGASVPIAEGIEILDTRRSLFFRLRSLLYQFSEDALLDETATDGDVRALASALLLGQRSSLNPAIVAAFQITNLAHFISLSGMHVGILAGSLWILLRTAQIPKRPRAVLCIILILTYAMIVPPRAPTMRAVFLSCFFFASALFGRRVHPLNTLALSAIVLLFMRPYELFSAGWQLSFLSVFGILLLYPPVRYQLLDKCFFPVVYLFRKRLVRIQHLLYGILELLAVGIAAWIMISPVMLFHFGQINPLSPVWTVLAFPAVLVILYAGFLKIVLASLLPSAAAVSGAVLNLAAGVLEKTVLLLSEIDILAVTANLHPGTLLLFYLLLAGLFLIPSYYRRLRRHVGLLLSACILLPVASPFSVFAAPKLELTCLSVGHGQAVVVSTPTGEDLLFDAGSITHQQIARKIIMPYLQHRRIFQLDGIFISHGDMDHLNALPDVAAMLKTGTVYGNPVFLQNAQQYSLEKTVADQLRQYGSSVVPIQNCQYDNVSIHSLWPLEYASDDTLSENDRSQVFLIEYAGRKILLCGDIETYGQNSLLELYPDLKTDVMILPHHGSTINLNTQFVDHFEPSVIIASCAERSLANAYRPPSHEITHCFYTARDGAVTVTIKADGALSAIGLMNETK